MQRNSIDELNPFLLTGTDKVFNKTDTAIDQRKDVFLDAGAQMNVIGDIQALELSKFMGIKLKPKKYHNNFHFRRF